VKVAQALLPPTEAWMAAPLQRHGFQHITRLWYLRKRVTSQGPQPVGLDCQPYLANPNLFHETLLRSYEGTLDCPELTGVRTIGEIIEGHQAQGAFNPDLWWLARVAGRPAGVLLVAETPEWESWDVSYVGVVPEARRRGLGRALMLQALAEARRRKANHLTVAVDARNQPAQKLYEALGFEPFDEREVFLVVWSAG
jgi:GNAT superfamily N-acetyltransferase